MEAVLLAAGEGLRLRPLTETIPKPLLEVLGESILERIIESLATFGVDTFIIVTNFLEDLIKEYISSKFPDRKVIFVHQTEIKGTADALLLAKEHINNDFFLVVNGDCIYSAPLVQKSVEAAKIKTISVGGKYTKETEKYGIIITDESQNLERMLEKPPKEEVDKGYANIGIYSLNKEIFSIIEKMEKENSFSIRGEYEIPDALNVLLERKAYPTKLIKLEEEDYWFDIGLPWNLLDANQTLLEYYNEEQKGIIEEGVTIKGKAVIKKDAIIRSGVYIEGPVFIDEEADIGPNCYIRKNSYLGKKSRIGNGCEVKNSIIGNGTHAAHLSYIGDSIIGSNCNLGAGTITANLRLDKASIRVKIKGKSEDSGRRKLGVMIGNEVEIGIGVLLMPGVKIGNNSWIGAGTIVNEDIPSESIYYGTQNYILKRKRKDAD